MSFLNALRKKYWFFFINKITKTVISSQESQEVFKVFKRSLSGLSSELQFLAPKGAQEMLIFVRSSVRTSPVCLEHTICIFGPQILHEGTYKALRRHS